MCLRAIIRLNHFTLTFIGGDIQSFLLTFAYEFELFYCFITYKHHLFNYTV